MSKTADRAKVQQTQAQSDTAQAQQTQKAQQTQQRADKPLDSVARLTFEECLSKLTAMTADHGKMLSDHGKILSDHDQMFGVVCGKIDNLDKRVVALENGKPAQSAVKSDVDSAPVKGATQPVNQVASVSTGGAIEVNSDNIGRMIFRIPGATITMTQR